jgi:two-component sensor histidine kinase
VLTLAIHELSTNALKYGALATDQGRINVVWRVDNSKGAARLVVDWRESRPARPDWTPPVRRGLAAS